MCSLEVIYGSMVLMNILKGFMDDQSWDSFGVMGSWNKFLIVFVVFILLSFYSIRIYPSPTELNIQVRFHDFNPLVLLSFFFSLILPQRTCWPFFLLLWLYSYESFSNIVKGFVRCLQAILCRIPGYTITATPIPSHQVTIIDLEMGGAP